MLKAFLSFTVVVKKLNELYKSSVSSCHCLNMRLQRFFLDKQKLMDRINSITAEKLIFSYAVQMVKTSPCLGLGLVQSSAGHSWFLLVALAGGSCSPLEAGQGGLSMQPRDWARQAGSALGVSSWHWVVALRCSLQPWMRCSTTERTVHRGTTRPCC